MLKKLAASAALAITFASAQASITPIDTLPRQGDLTTTEQTFASNEWHDLAVGFTVGSAGFVTDILTSLRMNTSSLGPFYIGLASNAIIGQPSSPSYFTPPPGSLYEANVCTNVPIPQNNGRSSCDQGAFLNAPTFVLGANQALDITLNAFLPSAGTYWLYTRFRTDDVFATWTENASEPSSLIARRTGFCTGDTTSCNRPADRTFFQATAAGPTPGIRVTFNPVPEPETLVLVAVGALALVLRRRKITP